MTSKIYKYLVVLVALVSFRNFSVAEEKGHAESEAEAGHDDHKDEGKEGESHEGHAGEEEGEEAESSAVGPEKGITEKGRNGFKFSAEAQKTIGYKTIPFTSTTFTSNKETLVRIKDEKSIFRVRDGWIKRIPAQVVSKTADTDTLTIKSDGLKEGDQIIVTQTGYIRIAEIFSSGGASHGHGH